MDGDPIPQNHDRLSTITFDDILNSAKTFDCYGQKLWRRRSIGTISERITALPDLIRDRYLEGIKNIPDHPSDDYKGPTDDETLWYVEELTENMKKYSDNQGFRSSDGNFYAEIDHHPESEASAILAAQLLSLNHEIKDFDTSLVVFTPKNNT